jgi:hypothetical protein
LVRDDRIEKADRLLHIAGLIAESGIPIGIPPGAIPDYRRIVFALALPIEVCPAIGTLRTASATAAKEKKCPWTISRSDQGCGDKALQSGQSAVSVSHDSSTGSALAALSADRKTTAASIEPNSVNQRMLDRFIEAHVGRKGVKT